LKCHAVSWSIIDTRNRRKARQICGQLNATLAARYCLIWPVLHQVQFHNQSGVNECYGDLSSVAVGKSACRVNVNALIFEITMPNFDEQYRSMTDEELLNLARDSQDLTPQARSSLDGELSKRRITSCEVASYEKEQRNEPRYKKFNPKAAYVVLPAPKAFFEELRSGILKKRVGQIALAVVLAQAIWRFVSSLTWYLIIPVLGRLQGQSESVLFSKSTARPIPLENLSGSTLEFVFTVIVVFYLNRWIHKKPIETQSASEAEYSTVGGPAASNSQPTAALE
jgi:large-conductance mechanosensitive channel